MTDGWETGAPREKKDCSGSTFVFIKTAFLELRFTSREARIVSASGRTHLP